MRYIKLFILLWGIVSCKSSNKNNFFKTNYLKLWNEESNIRYNVKDSLLELNFCYNKNVIDFNNALKEIDNKFTKDDKIKLLKSVKVISIQEWSTEESPQIEMIMQGEKSKYWKGMLEPVVDRVYDDYKIYFNKLYLEKLNLFCQGNFYELDFDKTYVIPREDASNLVSIKLTKNYYPSSFSIFLRKKK